MARKLNIGILCNELTRNFQNPLYKATKFWGKKLGVNLFFFEGRQLFGRKYSDIQHNVTYQLASEDLIDGYIFHPIFTHISHEQIVRWCKNYSNKPKVSINKRIADLTSCVMIDNYRGMKGLLDHLATTHQYNKIAFVYGAAHNDESRDRYRAYKDFMTSRNAMNEKHVFNGGFESDSGISAIQNIIASGIDFDAVVFSNDESAIAALDYLNTVDPKLKTKFAITGFDDSPHAQLTTPALTSVSQPFGDLARTSLELIIDMIEGKHKSTVERLLPTKLALRQSCGCQNRDILDTSSLKLFTTPYIVNENIESFNREEFFDKLTQALAPSSISSCYVALYERPFTFEATPLAADNSLLHYVYQDNIRIEIPSPINFKTKRLLPEEYLQSDEHINLVIQPLFYRDDHFGYVVFDGANAKEVDMDDIRSTISSNLHTIILFEDLNKALKDKNDALREVSLLNAQLSTMNVKLEKASRTDELTQVFNRRGFYSAIERKLKKNQLAMPITLFYADMDDLKKINDKMGHAAGDQAIALTASILSNCFRDEDIIGRMGGDEFVVFTAGCSENDIQRIMSRIETKMAEHESDEPSNFKLSLSMGYQTIHERSVEHVEKAIQAADEELYTIKRSKKRI